MDITQKILLDFGVSDWAGILTNPGGIALIDNDYIMASGSWILDYDQTLTVIQPYIEDYTITPFAIKPLKATSSTNWQEYIGTSYPQGTTINYIHFENEETEIEFSSTFGYVLALEAIELGSLNLSVAGTDLSLIREDNGIFRWYWGGTLIEKQSILADPDFYIKGTSYWLDWDGDTSFTPQDLMSGTDPRLTNYLYIFLLQDFSTLQPILFFGNLSKNIVFRLPLGTTMPSSLQLTINTRGLAWCTAWEVNPINWKLEINYPDELSGSRIVFTASSYYFNPSIFNFNLGTVIEVEDIVGWIGIIPIPKVSYKTKLSFSSASSIALWQDLEAIAYPEVMEVMGSWATGWTEHIRAFSVEINEDYTSNATLELDKRIFESWETHEILPPEFQDLIAPDKFIQVLANGFTIFSGFIQTIEATMGGITIKAKDLSYILARSQFLLAPEVDLTNLNAGIALEFLIGWLGLPDRLNLIPDDFPDIYNYKLLYNADDENYWTLKAGDNIWQFMSKIAKNCGIIIYCDYLGQLRARKLGFPDTYNPIVVDGELVRFNQLTIGNREIHDMIIFFVSDSGEELPVASYSIGEYLPPRFASYRPRPVKISFNPDQIQKLYEELDNIAEEFAAAPVEISLSITPTSSDWQNTLDQLTLGNGFNIVFPVTWTFKYPNLVKLFEGNYRLVSYNFRMTASEIPSIELRLQACEWFEGKYYDPLQQYTR